MKKSFVAVFSAAAIAVSSFGGTVAYGSVFSDINDVPWPGAAQYLEEAANLGLMAGYNENGQRYCKPKNNVTYCEAVQLMYAIMSSYTGTTISASIVDKWTSIMASKNIPSWAYNAVAYGLENSILSQNDISIFMSSASSQNYARREDVAVIFGKALSKVYSVSSSPSISYADKSKVATTSVPYLELLNRLNIMVGDSSNNFNPKVNINRSEMSVLVSKTNSTLKSGGNTGTSKPSTQPPSATVIQYSGKVTAKTSSGSGYSISVSDNGATKTFTTDASTTVTNGTASSTVDKINTGDSIVAVCSGNVATTIIVMSQGSSASASTEKGDINSVSTSKIALKKSSSTKEYSISNEDIPVTIDGSNSSLSSLVSKFKGGTNFSATISLDSNDKVVKIEAKRGSESKDDKDAVVSCTTSKIKLGDGTTLYFPDDDDDVTIKLDSKTKDIDELVDAYKDLDDDEQMIVSDYEADRKDVLESIKIKIEDKKSSSSSSKSSDKTGVVKSISKTKLTLKSGTEYKFADEDDISSLKIDSKSYDGDELEDFVDKVKDKMDDDSVYVELTLKSSKITKVVATTCDSDEGEVKEISSKTIKIGSKSYDIKSSTTISIIDGDDKIEKIKDFETAIDDDNKTIEATVILDDDEAISITGYVSEIEKAEIKKFNYDKSDTKCYLTLDLDNSSAKYYFTSKTDFKGDCDDLEELDDVVDDDDVKNVTLTLNEDGKIDKIDVTTK
ncbi:hypothetical protein IMSAG049_01361 [Clostridiales bacterium]|nr:hypothetical protein IMSAG049_01361 [Clostridiales bacterium]